MGIIKPAKRVKFADNNVERAFNELAENSPLKKSIIKVINKLKENVFMGEGIPKNLIPQEYIQKYGIDNLWWHPLADAWRLVYSIAGDKIEILAVIIEYFDHKNYERRFGYK
jgi:Txe/YoeB family toxin of Txe-Axe toxin-antitoxin module